MYNGVPINKPELFLQKLYQVFRLLYATTVGTLKIKANISIRIQDTHDYKLLV